MTEDPRAARRGLGWVRAVRVGSANRPKIAAVRATLRPYAPEARVTGLAVASGVSEQPIGFAEIARGAANRAHAALAAGADLGIGIEDGLVAVTSPGSGHPSGMPPHLNLGCAVVTDGTRSGYGLSSGFAYPPGVSERAVSEQAPIGDLFDRLWQERRGEGGGVPSGRGVGNVGKLTGGVLTRQEYGRHAVVCALVRFLHPDLYGEPDDTGEAAA
ncbi:MAG: DUF84 family protein [Myxococcales bacterium]|nr:DUF84 family protein [Myxococcales bacterium]